MVLGYVKINLNINIYFFVFVEENILKFIIKMVERIKNYNKETFGTILFVFCKIYDKIN